MPSTVALADTPRMRLLWWWTRLRLPGAQKLLRSAGVWDQKLWRGQPLRTCRGRWHGYRLQLDTGDFHQRGAYFYARSLDVDVQLCIRAALRPGDTFIDVGANIGLLSMLAAHRVGPRGRVIAFEPNPDVYERFLWHLRRNKLVQIEPHRLALSDHEAVMRLIVPPTGNTGAGSLGTLPARHGGRIGAEYDVPVQSGDPLLADLPASPVFLKLDVEGHEPAALRGLSRTVEHHAPAILVESNVEMLPANGTSVDELFGLLESWGYEPYALSNTWSRFGREWRLHLHRMEARWRPERTVNALFLKRDGIHAKRLAHVIAQPAQPP